MDIVTLMYSHSIDINLVKLQAISMKYVDPDLVNNIVLVYNDKQDFSIHDIIDYYPVHLQSKVKLIYADDLYKDTHPEWSSNWNTQQVTKIMISSMITTPYYLILDSKNHFIRPVNKSTFFYTDNSPYMYGYEGHSMNDQYNNCLEYYQTAHPEDILGYPDNIVDTITPYVLITQYVKDMVQYIENREQTDYFNFFIQYNHFRFTEFYLYAGYLMMTNNLQKYTYIMSICASIFACPCEWSRNFDNIFLPAMGNSSTKMVGLHRAAIDDLSFEHKTRLATEFYPTFFDEDVCKFIKNDILQLSKNKLKLIVARYNENLEWLDNLQNVDILIYNKGEPIESNYTVIPLPNLGREGHTFYNHIVTNYHTIDEYTIFVQGNPYDHCSNFTDVFNHIIADKEHMWLDEDRIIITNIAGCIWHEEIPLKECHNILFDVKCDEHEFYFSPGGQFGVSKERILKRPREFYEKIVRMLECYTNPIEGYVIERFNGLIFSDYCL